jgi:hypothetical protein
LAALSRVRLQEGKVVRVDNLDRIFSGYQKTKNSALLEASPASPLSPICPRHETQLGIMAACGSGHLAAVSGAPSSCYSSSGFLYSAEYLEEYGQESAVWLSDGFDKRDYTRMLKAFWDRFSGGKLSPLFSFS